MSSSSGGSGCCLLFQRALIDQAAAASPSKKKLEIYSDFILINSISALSDRFTLDTTTAAKMNRIRGRTARNKLMSTIHYESSSAVVGPRRRTLKNAPRNAIYTPTPLTALFAFATHNFNIAGCQEDRIRMHTFSGRADSRRKTRECGLK